MDFSHQFWAENRAEWEHSVKFEPKRGGGKDETLPPNDILNTLLEKRG